MAFDIKKERASFPNLTQDNSFVYFDNAATTHKPKVVIDSISDFYSKHNSNIHRSIHKSGSIATQKYEEARKRVQHFINANKSEEVIFTSGTTESINIVAQSFGEKFLKEKNVILLAPSEHHANIVPWQLIAKKKNAIIKLIPLNKDLSINIPSFISMLNVNVKLVAIQHISNVTGAIQKIKSIVREAHKLGASVLVDGAQAIAHTQINVVDLDCDFYCFSGHKAFGPTGLGVLFGKENILNAMDPIFGGGQMISRVKIDKSTWAPLPFKFESGTPNIAATIGLGEAIKYIETIKLENIQHQESELISYMSKKLSAIEGLISYNKAKIIAPIFSFNIVGIHHLDISTLLNEKNIAVRSGHHCAQPFMDYLEISGCIRASLSFYNTLEEIDVFIEALRSVILFLKGGHG